MKKIFRMALVFALAGATLMYTSCSKDYGEDIDKLDSKLSTVQTDLTNKLSDLEGRLSTLQSGVNALESAYKAADDAIKGDVTKLQNRVAAIEDAIKDLDKLATKEELKNVKEALEKKIADDLQAAKEELLAKTQNLQDQIDAINAALKLKADADKVYTKDEVDAFLAKYYTQEQIDAFLATKADKDAVFTKDEILAFLAEKADKSAVYTKEEIAEILEDYFTAEEVNALLAEKADKSAVYTKEEIAEILTAYFTKEEVVKILADYYTKAEIDELLAKYYTKAEIDELIAKYYTKDEVDGMLKNYFTKDEITEILTKYYTKDEADELLAKKADADKVYTKEEIDEILAKYYTKEQIDEMFAKYYTKEEIDGKLAGYYTKEEIDALFEKYYDKDEIDAMIKDVQDELNRVWALLSDELRSIVFLPDFYFAGIESTSYDFASFVGYEILTLAKDYEFEQVIEEEDEVEEEVVPVKYVLKKGAKYDADFLYYKEDGKIVFFKTNKDGAFILDKEGKLVKAGSNDQYKAPYALGVGTLGQVGKANYNLNPSSFNTDDAEWSLNGSNKKYVVKADDPTWYPVFEDIEKDETGLATVTYSIENPELIFSSVIGAMPFFYLPETITPGRPSVLDPDAVVSTWNKLQAALLRYNVNRSRTNNVPIMQLQADLDGNRSIVSDWHAITSFEEFVAHLAFADKNEYVTYVEEDCGIAAPATKDLYITAEDAVLNETNLNIKWNGGAQDLSKLIAIHTVDEDLNAFGDYTLEEFTAKYPGFHFEFELVPYTIGGNNTSEDMYGKIDGTMFTPCYVQSAGGSASSIVIPEGSEDGTSAIGRMPVVLVTLVNDETGFVQAYGWFKIFISKDVKPDQFFDIPDLGKVPYICGLFDLSTSWHEFSFFVLEALKVDYEKFIRLYDFTDIYAYVPTAKGIKFQSVVRGNNVSEGTPLNLGYVDPMSGKLVDLGQAMYSMDASGSGINDAFSWLVNPRGIGEGGSNAIYFKFVNDDQNVFFKMEANVAARAKMVFDNKIAKEWYADINGEALNTARMNVHVPNANEINPNVVPNVPGGDVLQYVRNLNHYFQSYTPSFDLSDDSDPIYQNFFNATSKGDPDAGADLNGDQNPDRFDDPELDTDFEYYFAKTQPEIGGTQLYSNWWGPGEETVIEYSEQYVEVQPAEEWWDNRWPYYHYRPAVYDWVTVETEKVVTYATGKLLYVATLGADKKPIMTDVTVNGQTVKVPAALPQSFIAHLEPRTTETLNNKVYRADTLRYFHTEPAKKLLNLYRHDATDQAKMLYADVVVKSGYGECGIELEDALFHVRFLRPLDIEYVDQNIAEESAVDGWNVELAKFISGITDWNGQPVLKKEMVKKDKSEVWTGYYVPNVIKNVDMYKYYVFKTLRIDLAYTEINNIEPSDPEKFFLLSEKVPGAKLAIGRAAIVDAEGKPIDPVDQPFEEITESDNLVTLGTNGTISVSINDFNALKGLVLNYRNDEGYSDPFTLKLRVSVDYAWGTLNDYIFINVGETTDHNVE